MIEEYPTVEEADLAVRKETLSQHNREVELLHDVLNLFLALKERARGAALPDSARLRFLLSVRAFNSLCAARELALRGYYTDANTLVRSAQEAWEIDLWVQLDESRSRLFLEPGHRVPRQADIRKKIPNELIREKAREYYDLLSEFTHPRYRSIVSLAEKKDNSTYVRIGGHYDKQQFLTCCYGLIPTAGLINNMLATVVPLNDEMKNHLMLVANRIAEWVQLINVEALVTPWSSVEPPSHAAIERLLREEGLSPITWDARPREMHVSHAHPCTNVLYCVRGSIRFTLDDTGQSIDLSPGDRLTLPAGTAHSATVGPEGVTCIEACRS